MKTILATIATVIVGFIALPSQAEARPHSGHIGQSITYVSGHTSCGCAIYKRKVVVGYDRYHRPIYRYYSVPIVHRCRSNHSSYRYNTPSRSHYGRSHYSRGNYSRSGVTISGRHGSVRIRR